MKCFHLFVDYKYLRTIFSSKEPGMLLALAELCKECATTERHNFTVLDVDDGFAFTQDYWIADNTTNPRKVSWGRMFKIEKGYDDYEPTFNSLLAQVQ